MKTRKSNSIANAFIAAIGTRYTGKTISVKFYGHTETDSFPLESMAMLKTDPATEWIADPETGELLFYR